MKLISKEKDFYDHFARNRALSDQTYIYNRTVNAQLVNFMLPEPYIDDGKLNGTAKNAPKDGFQYGVYVFLIYFCGKIVPCARIHKSSSIDNISSDMYFYRFEDIPEWVVGKKPNKRDCFFNRYWHIYDLFQLGNNPSGQWPKTYFTNYFSKHSGRTLNKMSIIDMHREVKSPVFCHAHVLAEYHYVELENYDPNIYKHNIPPMIVVNPSLSLMNFSKYMDAFSAFQDIERFISNELAPKDIRLDTPIPDKIKAESKGFDKHSFRKEPSKK